MSIADRTTYRHGNLHTDAIAAAKEIVNKAGHAAVSMRAVAQMTGVAHRSLYNHFPDREELLNHVAAEGFDQLAAELERTTTKTEFISVYARFALDNAGMSALLNSRPHATMRQFPLLQEATHRVITQAMRLFATGMTDAAERRRTVMKVYVLLQGATMLHRSGVLDVEDDTGFVAMLEEMLA